VLEGDVVAHEGENRFIRKIKIIRDFNSFVLIKPCP
jgi:hypothetical protein